MPCRLRGWSINNVDRGCTSIMLRFEPIAVQCSLACRRNKRRRKRARLCLHLIAARRRTLKVPTAFTFMTRAKPSKSCGSPLLWHTTTKNPTSREGEGNAVDIAPPWCSKRVQVVEIIVTKWNRQGTTHGTTASNNGSAAPAVDHRCSAQPFIAHLL